MLMERIIEEFKIVRGERLRKKRGKISLICSQKFNNCQHKLSENSGPVFK